ncbi:tetratricopeptide repeat protein [Paenibacillus sp. JDR-2]|uniref:tetratricopeptide repeat protein n=1 Tax=Paenibacillus sp. (strain JDR-2) TaxID=324057 RepID=UPI000166A416|nr:tetratricopeptide repeat protein [Paenibacillus sp. JDR-2]ACT00125.1 TPR repeat-containing protein [Paenibacillus sp. JDR-2]
MGKLFLLFVFFTWLFGNPIIAIIALLFIVYVIDRRFIGLTPSLLKPIRRSSRLSKLKKHIAQSPNDTSAKVEIARILIEKKKYREALNLLEPLERMLDDSAEYWDDLGLCQMQTGQPEAGEAAMSKALLLNPRVKYGAPYLRLASYYSKLDAERALSYIEAFQEIHSSSCEAYYRLADIYEQMSRKEDAMEAVSEGLRIYRSLPRYKKRVERKWALRLFIRKTRG